MSNIHRSSSTSAATLAVGVLASVALAGAGIWLIGAVTPTERAAQALTAAFALVLVVTAWFSLRGARPLQLAVVASVIGTFAVFGGATQLLSSQVDKRVDDEVVVALPAETAESMEKADNTMEKPAAAMEKGVAPVALATGSFESLAHETSGSVNIVELPSGERRLQIEGFTTDSGPDLYVIAVKGDPADDGDVDDYTTIARLKGTSGNQVYPLPASFDPAEYSHVYIWCKAFTVGFGRAAI